MRHDIITDFAVEPYLKNVRFKDVFVWNGETMTRTDCLDFLKSHGIAITEDISDKAIRKFIYSSKTNKTQTLPFVFKTQSQAIQFLLSQIPNHNAHQSNAYKALIDFKLNEVN